MAGIGRRVLLVVGCVMAVGWMAGATAQEAKGAIDWQQRTIRAKGSGAPDLRAPNIAVARLGAERAAKLDAVRNILETLKGVDVSSGSSAGGVMASDSAVKAKVEGLARGFKVVDTRYFSDGGVEVDVEMPIDGELAQALMPAGEARAVPTEGAKKHSGLVIDATGKALTPALAPRILDEAGNEVFGPHFVNAQALQDRGVAGYANDLGAATKSERVGAEPMVIKALAAKGADLVITNADAAAFRGGRQDLSFLAEGRVLIVID